MEFHNSLLALIDTRSFSNIWFWFALAAMWSWLSHYILGVPFDMIARARREGGVALQELEAVVAAHVQRRLRMASGPWAVAVLSGGLTVLALLGFGHGLQLAQALFLLALPAVVVAAMGQVAARRLGRDPLAGEALCAYLVRHRLWVHLVGLVSIFVTTLWAMVAVLFASLPGAF
ncbi:component of SufBCD complex [Rhodobaculum claviforme]|uniref:Component of SufBCD complex n=1 Tax=Rhodobaculum claviforme TaxID=1549854 RepID=A0A934TIK4_9RHOB|nr:component of SufBCD complex [Rhodobaculum claviforme]MBK5926482.1 hypothetical protein [Rhodobaculum claviforme]